MDNRKVTAACYSDTGIDSLKLSFTYQPVKISEGGVPLDKAVMLIVDDYIMHKSRETLVWLKKKLNFREANIMPKFCF